MENVESKKQSSIKTRGTGKSYLITQLTGDSLFLLILPCFLFIRGYKLIDSYWYQNQGKTLVLLGFTFFIMGLLSACYHIMVSKSYVELHTDRICELGMQGVQNKSNGGVFLFINTNGGNYKVITTEERAKEVIDYYESNK